jgi:hypothetical protein
MNLKQLRSRITKAIVSVSMLFGIALVVGTTAHAQNYPYGRDGDYRRDQDRDGDYRRDRDNDRYRRNRNNGYGGYNNIYRIAQDRGYQDGLYTGESDAQRRQSYDPQRSHYYKNADAGYNSSYGNRNAYKQAYRDAFMQGYDQGYRRYGGNGRGYPRNYPRTRSILGDIFGRP